MSLVQDKAHTPSTNTSTNLVHFLRQILQINLTKVPDFLSLKGEKVIWPEWGSILLHPHLWILFF